MTLWQRVLAALAIGETIGFASEMQFYITPEFALAPFDTPLTWLLYSFTTWLSLGLAAWLGVRSRVSLFLIVCIFGRMIESVVVATVFNTPAPAWLRFRFMLMPLLTALIATQGWQRVQNIESNWPIALLLTASALGIYLFAAIAAMRTPQ